jgi:hypothetical protein
MKMVFPKFYINIGRRCAQTAIKSVATFDSISLDQLDKLTGFTTNREIVTPVQIVYALQQIGSKFFYPVKQIFIEGNMNQLEKKSLTIFGQEIVNKVNRKHVEESWVSIKESNNYYLNGKPHIKEELNLGRIPICLINYDIYVGRKDKKTGHYLIILAMGEKFVDIMDSGPSEASPTKRISKKRFENSLMETPLDYGVVFVKKCL